MKHTNTPRRCEAIEREMMRWRRSQWVEVGQHMEWAYNWKDVKNEVSVRSIEGKGHGGRALKWAQSMLIRATNHRRTRTISLCLLISLLFSSTSSVFYFDLNSCLTSQSLSASVEQYCGVRGGTVCDGDGEKEDGDKEPESVCWLYKWLLAGVEGMAALSAPTQALPPGTGNPANCSPWHRLQ